MARARRTICDDFERADLEQALAVRYDVARLPATRDGIVDVILVHAEIDAELVGAASDTSRPPARNSSALQASEQGERHSLFDVVRHLELDNLSDALGSEYDA